jgi:adenosine/AMP kinase
VHGQAGRLDANRDNQNHKPEDINFILRRSLHQDGGGSSRALINTVPDRSAAFCEASGKYLVHGGTDEEMIKLATANAQAVGAGHSFIIFLGQGYFPINVLNAVKAVPEVARIFCATANPAEVLVATTDLGRGLLGVIDGAAPKGIEQAEDILWRKDLLRKIGYKS